MERGHLTCSDETSGGYKIKSQEGNHVKKFIAKLLSKVVGCLPTIPASKPSPIMKWGQVETNWGMPDATASASCVHLASLSTLARPGAVFRRRQALAFVEAMGNLVSMTRIKIKGRFASSLLEWSSFTECPHINGPLNRPDRVMAACQVVLGVHYGMQDISRLIELLLLSSVEASKVGSGRDGDQREKPSFKAVGHMMFAPDIYGKH